MSFVWFSNTPTLQHSSRRLRSAFTERSLPGIELKLYLLGPGLYLPWRLRLKRSCLQTNKLYAQHDQRKLYGNRIRRAVLATCTAVPAFIRVTHVKHIVFQVKHIQGAMRIADTAGIAFLTIDYGRHNVFLSVDFQIINFKDVCR